MAKQKVLKSATDLKLLLENIRDTTAELGEYRKAINDCRMDVVPNVARLICDCALAIRDLADMQAHLHALAGMQETKAALEEKERLLANIETV